MQSSACNSHACSAYSEQVEAVTLPAVTGLADVPPPANIAASAITDTEATITWTKPVSPFPDVAHTYVPDDTAGHA